jgi:hypothetical protein
MVGHRPGGFISRFDAALVNPGLHWSFFCQSNVMRSSGKPLVGRIEIR